ncbi:MAG: SPFH domain-containing protein, partial [Planctomycetota bacterium]|nr:SPFH domain-containing protein [Planctomycetota bacterium]
MGETHQTQVIQPGGPHLAFPYPFEQVIAVPTTPTILRLDEAFWWQVQQGIDADQPKETPLNPAFDGSLLTADANIMHARWSLTFQIRRDTTGGIDPEAVIDFVQNVGSNEAAERIVRAAAEQAVVLTAAVTKADDLMKSSFDKAAASERIRNSLKSLRTGLHVSQLSITRPTMPGPVRGVYQLVTQAAAAKSKRIDEARKQRDQILKDAAGDAHGPLWELVRAYEQAHLGHTDEDRAAADEILAGIHNALRRKR